ncbi:lipoprotein [Metasolibacillus meyeri]|uniref:lipoprotein n=1 Tax=Metasolibacillus meyeri TaxID=1071052 RepID=UPI000D2FAC0D|nr:lipoprotein [Metasolibacillus meyeri]
MKRSLIALLIVLLLAACQPNDVKKVPIGEIHVDNQNYQMVDAGHEWIDGNVTIRAPRIGKSIYGYASQFETLSVPSNNELLLKIKESPDTIAVQQYNKDGEMEIVNVIDNKILLPSVEGYYLYEVVAQWENGSMVTFVFDVELSN